MPTRYPNLPPVPADRWNAQTTGPSEATTRRTAMTPTQPVPTTPPDGYTIPPQVARLVEHARTHGWRTLLQWDTESAEVPFLTVQVGRRAGADDGPGPYWWYRLTWHNRDLPHGRLRLFRSGIAHTPTQPKAHDAPSIRAIHEVITAHPLPAAEQP
ncbi:hypothetical protein [Streptacidiphilus monticola]|uniref:DUF317 domain-containing protein n=1 Tax=Streptacidiphilus monticola TaxID=2161674 RepID=A0ABW1GA38_9ACTN